MALSTTPAHFSLMNKLVLKGKVREGSLEEVSVLPGNVRRCPASWRGDSNRRHFLCYRKLAVGKGPRFANSGASRLSKPPKP